MNEKLKVGMGYELGDVGTRFVALLIDGFILGIISSILLGTAGTSGGGGASLVIGVLYNWYFWTRQDGQTPGKRIMKLRVVKADGSQLSDVDAVIRAVSYYVSGLVCGLGYFWALLDDQNRTWHDLLAGTLVVTADE